METRASNVLVGLFTLGAIAGIVGALVWLAGADRDTRLRPYRIAFTESVAGLEVAADVCLHGVRVGRVREIAVDPADPTRVVVGVSIREKTQILEGAVANLQPQGLTGLSFIDIEMPRAGAPALAASAPGEPPEIPSRPSGLRRVLDEAPALVHETRDLLARASELLDAPNRRALGATLANLETITANLAAESDAVRTLRPKVEGTLDRLASAADAVERLARAGERAVRDDLPAARRRLARLADEEVPALIADSRRSLQAVERLVDHLDAELRGRVGLAVRRLVGKLRGIADTVGRIADRLEASPREFLLGGPAAAGGRP